MIDYVHKYLFPKEKYHPQKENLVIETLFSFSTLFFSYVENSHKNKSF